MWGNRREVRSLGLGAQELVIILLILLVIFGGRKIPELAKGLGRGIKEFKKASGDDDDDKISGGGTPPVGKD
jgi:sec-independent protein translocase protein TatA